MWNTVFIVLAVILSIVLIAMVALYFVGRNLEKRQAEQQSAIEAAKQTVSLLVIDKKKLKIKDSGLPKIVYEQTPLYLRWSKLPIIKAKVGPKIMTLMADEKVFKAIPVKAEVKVVISGIYISEIKSVRGKALVNTEEKKGFFARLFKR